MFSSDDWDHAREALQDAGVKLVDRCLAAAHLNDVPADEVADFCFVQANWPGLTPGAILTRIETGSWPADNVPTGEQLRAHRKRHATSQQTRREEKARDLARKEICDQRRKAKLPPLSDAEINQEIDVRLMRTER